LVFHKRKALYKKSAFDFLFGKPTHVVPCARLSSATSYVTKLGNFVQAGEPLTTPKKPTPRAQIVDFLKDERRVLSDLREISSPPVDQQLYLDAHRVDRWYVRVQA
jgi:hypothetical protein